MACNISAAQLFDGFDVTIHGNSEIIIKGLCSHSKRVQDGDLFIAKKGQSYDGGDFIDDVIKSGAVAVFMSAESLEKLLRKLDNVKNGEMFDSNKTNVGNLTNKTSDRITDDRKNGFYNLPEFSTTAANVKNVTCECKSSTKTVFIKNKCKNIIGTLNECLHATKNHHVNDCVLTQVVNILVVVGDVKSLEHEVANKFYRYPSKFLNVVGVTGTNGKSTTSYMIQQMLTESSCGFIGNLPGKYTGKTTDCTTAEITANLRIMNKMKEDGLKNVVMEVTSHGLTQDRVKGIDFDVAVFTNLSPEHLEYHKTLESYIKAKEKLFSYIDDERKSAVVNVDNDYSARMIKNCRGNVLKIGIERTADISAFQIHTNLLNTKFVVSVFGVKYKVSQSMIGKHNVYNALCAIGAVLELKRNLIIDISIGEILKNLGEIKYVPGRLERVSNSCMTMVFVDFAHTYIALESVLSTLYEIKKRKLITIFHCGGERYRDRRPYCAKIAEKYSDKVIVTQGNMRFEDPEQIFNDISQGFADKTKIIFEHDRRRAIEIGIQNSQQNDIVIICGRGHDTLLRVKGQTYEFDDRLVAKEIIQKRQQREK